jgi:hypothetical protein
MPKKLNILIILIVVIILIFVLPLRFEGFATQKTFEISDTPMIHAERTRIPAMGSVIGKDDPNLGISTDTHIIGFGIIAAGGYSKRHINTSNDRDIRAKIRLESSGNISQLLHFESNNFILYPGESKPVKVRFEADEAATPGNYSGEVIITVIEPKNSFADMLLEWL